MRVPGHVNISSFASCAEMLYQPKNGTTVLTAHKILSQFMCYGNLLRNISVYPKEPIMLSHIYLWAGVLSGAGVDPPRDAPARLEGGQLGRRAAGRPSSLIPKQAAVAPASRLAQSSAKPAAAYLTGLTSIPRLGSAAPSASSSTKPNRSGPRIPALSLCAKLSPTISLVRSLKLVL